MHGSSCTSRTLFHLLWHPRTLFLDSERKVFRRKHAPCNQVDQCFGAKSGCCAMPMQREGALLRPLLSRLLARGVRLWASNVGFVQDPTNGSVLVCNFIGVATNRIALVLGYESNDDKPALRRYLQTLQKLLTPLLITQTRLVFFVFCLCTWRTKGRLVLRRVSP